MQANDKIDGLVPVVANGGVAKSRGRKPGKAAAIAKAESEQRQTSGLAPVIAEAQHTVATAEQVATEIEAAASSIIVDRLAAVPANIQARVLQEVQDTDPATFRAESDTWARSLRTAGGASELFAMVSGADGVDGNE